MQYLEMPIAVSVCRKIDNKVSRGQEPYKLRNEIDSLELPDPIDERNTNETKSKTARKKSKKRKS